MLQLIIQLSTLLQMPLLYTIVQSMIITNSLTPFKPKFKGTIAFFVDEIGESDRSDTNLLAHENN